MNVTRDLQDALADLSMAEELDLVCSNPKNVVPDCLDEIEREYGDFKIFMLDSKNSFFVHFLMDFIIQS